MSGVPARASPVLHASVLPTAAHVTRACTYIIMGACEAACGVHREPAACTMDKYQAAAAAARVLSAATTTAQWLRTAATYNFLTAVPQSFALLACLLFLAIVFPFFTRKAAPRLPEDADAYAPFARHERHKYSVVAWLRFFASCMVAGVALLTFLVAARSYGSICEHSADRRYAACESAHFTLVVRETHAVPWKASITVNGTSPGPVLRVPVGHCVHVTVVNQMDVATSVHWHGMLQRGTQLNDGAPGITQCPIPPRSSKRSNLTYTFSADTVRNAAHARLFVAHTRMAVKPRAESHAPAATRAPDARTACAQNRVSVLLCSWRAGRCGGAGRIVNRLRARTHTGGHILVSRTPGQSVS